jgi:hypothetical protein
MDEIQFLIQGSAPEPYTVTFRKRGTKLNVFCSCPAGENRQYCNHRMRILSGMADGIVSGNLPEILVAISWVSGTTLESALNSLSEAQEQYETARRSLSAAKKRVARLLHE